MILATKNALQSRVRIAVLHIREKELFYFYSACNQVATQSALLAGFCYSGFTFLSYIDGDICERACAEFFFPITVTSAMGCSMLALWQATLASMLAPGLALRGPPGSMDLAVTQLVEEYQGAMRLFVLSTFLFMFTSLLWSWTLSSWYMTAIGTFMILATMSIIHAAIVHVADDFDFDQNDTVTGGWTPAPGPATTLGSGEVTAEERDAAASRRRAERAGLPWYRRSRAFQVLVGPLLLPEPMKLY